MAKPENERERIARIIDPVAHHKARIFGAVTEGAVWVRRYRRALEKADAIIAQRETGEPVAWTFEYLCDNGVDEPTWEPGASVLNPSKWTAFQHRNIQPAFAAPQALAEPVADDEWPRALARLKHTEPHPDQGIACVGTDDLAMALNRLEKFAEVALGNAVEVSRLLAAQAEAQARIEALTYASDVRWRELADGSPFTVIDRQMLGTLYEKANAALSGSTPKPAGVEITGDDAIRAAIVELDERVYRRTMQQVNAMAILGDGSARDRKDFVARTERMNDLLDGLKACLSPALTAALSGDAG